MAVKKKKKLPNYRERVKKLEKQLDKAWSEAVRERDVVCQKCGGSGALSAHHTFGRRNEATRWDMENGTLLCLPHHLYWAHRDIGSFIVWFQQRVGEDTYNRLVEAHNRPALFTEEILQKMLIDIKALTT